MITRETEIIEMIDDIAKVEIELWEDTKKELEARKDFELECLKIKQQINSEKTKEDKFVFSNDNARETELKLRLNSNKKMMQEIEKLDKLKDNLKIKSINLDAKKRKFSVLKILLGVRI